MSSTKSTLRLAEQIDGDGRLSERGADGLIESVDEFTKIAYTSGCKQVMAFATSAVRDAANCDEVLERVAEATGVRVVVLSGVDEARLTSLAVRRWYLSAVTLLVLAGQAVLFTTSPPWPSG